MTLSKNRRKVRATVANLCLAMGIALLVGGLCGAVVSWPRWGSGTMLGVALLGAITLACGTMAQDAKLRGQIIAGGLAGAIVGSMVIHILWMYQSRMAAHPATFSVSFLLAVAACSLALPLRMYAEAFYEAVVPLFSKILQVSGLFFIVSGGILLNIGTTPLIDTWWVTMWSGVVLTTISAVYSFTVGQTCRRLLWCIGPVGSIALLRGLMDMNAYPSLADHEVVHMFVRVGIGSMICLICGAVLGHKVLNHDDETLAADDSAPNN